MYALEGDRPAAMGNVFRPGYGTTFHIDLPTE